MKSQSYVIVALDFSDFDELKYFVSILNPKLCKLKVGKELFTKFGPKVVEFLQSKGFDIFLDLKFHDTPNTVEKAVIEACKKNVWMLNIHLSGGRNMIESAVKAKNSISPEILLIGVTILTSLDENDLYDIGVSKNLQNHINSLLSLGKRAGIDGIVCSPKDLDYFDKEEMNSLISICPGIRVNEESGGQKRTATINEAIKMGADYIVIAREIIASPNPSKVVSEIDSFFI